MKKKIFTVLVVLMVLLTACGGSQDDVIEPEVDTTADIQSESVDELETEKVDEDEPKEVADKAESETVEDEAEAEATVDLETTVDDGQDEEVSDSEEYKTLEEYYITHKSELDAEWLSMSEEGLSVNAEVNDNNFIVTIKILDSSVIVDGLREALAEALDKQADIFKSQVGVFDEELGFESGTCTVTMRYTDPDDNVLAEKTYRNDK